MHKTLPKLAWNCQNWLTFQRLNDTVRTLTVKAYILRLLVRHLIYSQASAGFHPVCCMTTAFSTCTNSLLSFLYTIGFLDGLLRGQRNSFGLSKTECIMSEHRLSEITIERPRSGMRRSLRKVKGARKQLDRLTQEATEDGLLSPYLIKPRGKTKWLSDHLGPLRRYLRSHLNQPWNDIYSKLCQQLDTNTMAGQHVLSHLWDYVELHVELIDGVPYYKTRGGYCDTLENCYRDQFYVHPETGLLCAVAKKPRKHKRGQARTDIVVVDAYHRYQKLNEIWYLITFAAFPPFPETHVRDVLRGKVAQGEAEYIEGKRVYAAQKKQCNKKEIRFILSQISQVTNSV